MRYGIFCVGLILAICTSAVAYERHPDGRITLSAEEAGHVQANFGKAMQLIQIQQAEIERLRVAYETKACI